MRWSPLHRIVLAACATLLLAGCGPVSAALHDPRDLPAFERDPRVHYDANARGYAEAVAKLLPAAITRVEAAQGGPFARPFVVAAYLDDDAYAAANGLGSPKARGVTYFDRVAMSPALWREEPAYLEADFVHELSHEHLWGHLSAVEYFQIPVWFVEGLAVMVSGGGGAQRVSAEDAEREIVAGRVIETPDTAFLFGNLGVKPPPARMENEDQRVRMHMAYRQAGLFVSFLRAQNREGFKSLLERLISGERFKPAFEASFGTSVAAMRERFLTVLRGAAS
ncbi:MAG: hypothetical protein WB816_18830 [Methylocystis sp.]